MCYTGTCPHERLSGECSLDCCPYGDTPDEQHDIDSEIDDKKSELYDLYTHGEITGTKAKNMLYRYVSSVCKQY